VPFIARRATKGSNPTFVIPSRARNLCCSCRFQFRRCQTVGLPPRYLARLGMTISPVMGPFKPKPPESAAPRLQLTDVQEKRGICFNPGHSTLRPVVIFIVIVLVVRECPRGLMLPQRRTGPARCRLAILLPAVIGIVRATVPVVTTRQFSRHSRPVLTWRRSLGQVPDLDVWLESSVRTGRSEFSPGLMLSGRRARHWPWARNA
jgi:hypothetical protein